MEYGPFLEEFKKGFGNYEYDNRNGIDNRELKVALGPNLQHVIVKGPIIMPFFFFFFRQKRAKQRVEISGSWNQLAAGMYKVETRTTWTHFSNHLGGLVWVTEGNKPSTSRPLVVKTIEIPRVYLKMVQFYSAGKARAFFYSTNSLRLQVGTDS